MADPARDCPDCRISDTQAHDALNRRNFLKVTAAGAAAVTGVAGTVCADTTPGAPTAPETLVKSLFDSLSETQRSKVCFAWDHKSKDYGLLRTHISNNWNITEPMIRSDFYTADQQAMVRQIFEGIIQPDWHQRIDKQLQDDAGGFGRSQSIAIFGTPGKDFEFVMTGRHMTLRCDGNSTEHMAFGGPIFYGHAASGFNEKPNHPGNVFWHQALAANKVYAMLDEKQRQRALVEKLPVEEAVEFHGPAGPYPGLPVAGHEQRSALAGPGSADQAGGTVSRHGPR